MTIDTIGDMEAFEFGTQVIRTWGIGQASVNNGMLIYTTTAQGEGNNDVWISVGQGLGEQFLDGKLGRMIDYYMLGSLMEGDFTTAFEEILAVTRQEMLGEIEDADPGEASLVGTLIIVLIVLLFFGIVFLIARKVNKNKQFLRDRGWTVSSGSGSNSSNSNDGFGGGNSDGGGAGRNF